MKLLIGSINIADVVALGVIAGTIAKLLPELAALLAVVYYGFVIYDRIRYGPELERRTTYDQKDMTKSEKKENNDAIGKT